MKKLFYFVSVIVLVCFTVSCNFSKSGKLETKIKTSMKKEAKLNGVKLKFNELECIELDTIPDEFNTPYLKYMIYENYEEYSLHKKTCYLVYVDALAKIANVPIRTQVIALYTYNKNRKDFDMLYHSESNCQERFNRYK